MKGGSMPINRLEKDLWRRHLHIVACGHAEGAVTPDAKVDTARFDKRRHLGFYQTGLGWRSGDRDIVGKPLAS